MLRVASESRIPRPFVVGLACFITSSFCIAAIYYAYCPFNLVFDICSSILVPVGGTGDRYLKFWSENQILLRICFSLSALERLNHGPRSQNWEERLDGR